MPWPCLPVTLRSPSSQPSTSPLTVYSEMRPWTPHIWLSSTRLRVLWLTTASPWATSWASYGSSLSSLVSRQARAGNVGDLAGPWQGAWITNLILHPGITQLRFKPAYNPYTEPSMEVFSYHQGQTGAQYWGREGGLRLTPLCLGLLTAMPATYLLSSLSGPTSPTQTTPSFCTHRLEEVGRGWELWALPP